MNKFIPSFLVAFVLLQRLDKVQVIELNIFIGKVFAEKIELIIVQRNLVVVQN